MSDLSKISSAIEGKAAAQAAPDPPPGADKLAKPKHPDHQLPNQILDDLRGPLALAGYALQERVLTKRRARLGVTELVGGDERSFFMYFSSADIERLDEIAYYGFIFGSKDNLFVVHETSAAAFVEAKVMLKSWGEYVHQVEPHQWAELKLLLDRPEDLALLVGVPFPAPVPGAAVQQPPGMPLVVVSCAVDDPDLPDEEVERLRRYTAGLANIAEVWLPHDVEAGLDLGAEVAARIESAACVLVLVTQKYLTERKAPELEPIVARRDEGLNIYWMLAGPADIKDSPLHGTKPAHSIKKSLSELDEPQRNRALVEVLQQVRRKLEEGPADA